MARPIRGAGGKGGGAAKASVESPDSLRSIAYARVLDLVSEGEIVGFADIAKPLTCVYFNETPVQNADNTTNFKNFTIDSRVGSQVQSPIEGFAGVESESVVGLRLLFGTPWTRAFTNINITAIRVRLSVGALTKIDTTNGNVNGSVVLYKIELATDGGAFIVKLDTEFRGKASNKYERSHRIELPRATTGWTVRVTRSTVDSNTQTIQDITYVESITEIIDAKLRLPMSAYVGVIIDAEQFNSIPSRAYRLRGRIIRIPSNYNPVTRVYTGIWDGTFGTSYTTNPAWVFYDMVINNRYGLGHLVPADLIDKWALYKIAQYCDVLVPNGFGGTEPRFTCNVYLQTQQDALKVLMDLCSVFRGIMYAAAGAITAIGDMPEDPVYTYAPANVVDGKFAYSGTSRKVRHTVALVSWNDMSDFGRAKIEYVEDTDGIARYGLQQTEVVAVGCTSRGQALRMGKYILTTERYETDILSFSVGLDGTIPAPGKIILVSDPLRAGRRTGGRIRSATATSITVDNLPVVAIGNEVTVTLPNGGVSTRVVSAVAGNVITVSVAFAAIPVAQSVWLIETTGLKAQRFRVLGVAEKSDGIGHDIVAIEHVEGKFAFVEQNIAINQLPISGNMGRVLFAPTNILMTHYDVFEQNVTQKIVTLNWLPVANAQSYNVMYRLNNNSWINVGDTTAPNIDIHSMPSGVFEVQVTAINGPVRSQPAYAGPFDLTPNTRSPGFVAAQNESIANALLSAQNAQATADGAVVSFWQTTAPVIGTGAGQASVGDIWFNTADGNKVYRVVGTVWTLAADDDMAQAILAASSAQATADGKIKTFFSVTAPTATGLGDLWFNTVVKKLFRWNGATWVDEIADVTLAQLGGGGGGNLLPDQYSTLEAVALPLYHAANGTLSRDATDKIVAAALVFSATAGDQYAYFGGTYNIPVTPGKRYIVSLNAKGSVAGPCNIYLQDSNTIHYEGAVAVTTAWARPSVLLDLTASTATAMRLRVDNDLGVGTTLRVDGVMVEEAIGTLNRPSSYARGQAASNSLAALVAAQNAQATADGSIDIYRQSAAPAIGGSGAKFGDYWQDTDDGRWWYCNGSSWIESTDSRLPQVVIAAADAHSAANTAQGTANARIRLFVQEAQPSGGTYIVGDQWFQASTTLTRYFNGTGWSALADQTAAFVGDSIINPKFDAGFVGWQNQGVWQAQATGGFGNTPRALVIGPTTLVRLYNDAKYQVRPGGKLGLYATVVRNVVVADGAFYIGAFFYTASGAWNGNIDVQVLHADVPSGYVLVRKFVDVPLGTAYALFVLSAAPDAGGAWGVDNCHMQMLADTVETTTGDSANLLPNSNFGGVNGGFSPWALGWNPAVAAVNINNRKTGILAGEVWIPGGQLGALEVVLGAPAGGLPALFDINCGGPANYTAASAGQRYEFHAKVAAHRCTVQVCIGFMDASFNTIYENGSVYGGGYGTDEGQYQHVGGFEIAPAGTRWVRFWYRCSDTDVGQPSSYRWLIKPYLGRAKANQTTFSDWSASNLHNADSIGAGTNAGVVDVGDLFEVAGWRRVGTSARGSRKILGGARNMRANVVAGIVAVRTTAALTADSTGAVTVNAHSLELSGETVAYSTVINAVVGLTVEMQYIIYCFDLYLDGGVRTYYAQTSSLSAQQSGEGAVMMGQIIIPIGGTAIGGGGGGGIEPCVAIDMHLPDARYAHEVASGDFIECWDESDVPGVELVEVESNFPVDLIECIRIETVSGAAVVASRCTPMTLRDHSIRYMPEMLGEVVLVKRTGQPLQWERVVHLEHVGNRTVAKIKVRQRCYFAGEDADATIATHNPTYKP